MEKYFVLTDIEYGNHERQKVDIFIPQEVKNNSGLLLFVHGGGWSEGDKKAHYVDADYFSNLGYICASMNYRFVSDDINVFNELDDICSALETVKSKCNEYGFNIKKVILSGGSAGGHLSLLYSYTRTDDSPLYPVAVCVYCPPVDCSDKDFLLGISDEFDEWKYGVLSNCCGLKMSKDTFLNEREQSALKKISPKEYITEKCVPTAVFHGKNDDLVPLKQINDFTANLRKKGIKNDLLIYENSGHALDNDTETSLQSRKIFAEYIELYL